MVGAHGQIFEMPQLAVVPQMRGGGQQFVDACPETLLAFGVVDAVNLAELQSVAAVGPRLEEENGRQQVVGAQHLEHVAKGRQAPGRPQTGFFLVFEKVVDLLVEL